MKSRKKRQKIHGVAVGCEKVMASYFTRICNDILYFRLIFLMRQLLVVSHVGFKVAC